MVFTIALLNGLVKGLLNKYLIYGLGNIVHKLLFNEIYTLTDIISKNDVDHCRRGDIFRLTWYQRLETNTYYMEYYLPPNRMINNRKLTPCRFFADRAVFL